ncbi:MAG: TlyA family RNA methyltransferase [Armatimonadetes bacterium]|nr:TlyA family RNA methyltransferase [Armatimonadota bacterium]
MTHPSKERLDLLLVEQGLAPSREQAQRFIMSGSVLVDGRCLDKPGTRVPFTSNVEILSPSCPYVSRGGLKLERALDRFNVSPEGRVALDVGASTGGFTHCLLARGAVRVYSVDVGKGQLHWSLRENPRVVSLSGVNFRHAPPDLIREKVDLAVLDVSFISLSLMWRPLSAFLSAGAGVIALVKPQFEAGRKKVRGGVVRDPDVHKETVLAVIARARGQGFAARALTFSPLQGPAGNMEFFLLLGADLSSGEVLPEEVGSVVSQAHEFFRKGRKDAD